MRYFCLLVLIASRLPLYGISPINSNLEVPIGGIKQWISIKGVNDTDPVLLFLHGGPGNSAMSYAGRFTGELRKHFVVVQWDQRESGMTKKLNSVTTPLTVALFENDAVELINYLRKRFAKEKIYLMGHSWGGFLGMTIAARHAELLTCYLAVSPMIHQVESERLSLNRMLEKANETNNKEEINELSQVKIPFETGTQLYYHRKWLAIMMGQRPPPQAYVEAWSVTWLALFNEASQINFLTDAPQIKCPIYFFVGSMDYQTHFKLTEDYFKQVNADKKDLFWFTKSAHLVILTEPAKLQEIVIHLIMPTLQ